MGLCSNNCTAWNAWVWGDGSDQPYQPDPDIAGIGVRQPFFCTHRMIGSVDPLIVSCLDHHRLHSKQFRHPLLCSGILDSRCLNITGSESNRLLGLWDVRQTSALQAHQRVSGPLDSCHREGGPKPQRPTAIDGDVCSLGRLRHSLLNIWITICNRG